MTPREANRRTFVCDGSSGTVESSRARTFSTSTRSVVHDVCELGSTASDPSVRRGRRRRRKSSSICNVAVVAAVMTAAMSRVNSFVAPPATARASRFRRVVDIQSEAAGVSAAGNTAGRRRRASTGGAPLMVAMEPRRRMNGKTLGADVTVEPARPPGQEGPHLPWTQSMAGPEFPLNYMPFMEHMLNVLARSFGGQMRALPVKDKLAFVENRDKQARMLSMSFTSPEVRKVRLTYFDAGAKVQVLNAVIYPDTSLDLPFLGIDLISFGGKHLAGVDFQPLFEDEACRLRFSETLAPIKAKYPELSQKMSPRFYDSARFFSEEMLFGRYDDESLIQDVLFPAFEEYLATYISELRTAAAERGDPSPEARARILDRHRAYDQYNAERDPAHGLFRNYYGEKFAEEYMDEFLFELSTRPEGGYPKASAAQGCGKGGGGVRGDCQHQEAAGTHGHDGSSRL